MITNDNTELHDAILENDLTKAHTLIQQHYYLLHTSNPTTGDQPAHIAARLGNKNIIQLLVEYDVDLNHRNFKTLTPLGEARMNAHKDVVSYIQTLFFKQPDGTLARKAYYPHLRKYNIIPNEYDFKQKEAEQRKIYERINKETECAIRLQTRWRAKQAKLKLLYQRRWHNSAIKIQHFYHHFKWKMRFHEHRKRRRSSIIIQSIQRQKSTLHFYNEFLKDRLMHRRSSRNLAHHGQRIWRGYQGRRDARLMRAKFCYPNPSSQCNFEFWRGKTLESYPPKRKFGLYFEHILGGTPLSWSDRLCMHDGRFRDVTFYAHSITFKVQWDKPLDWKIQDEKELIEREEIRKLGFTTKENVFAKQLQSWWRSKRERTKLRFLVKAYKIPIQAEARYFQNPDDIKATCNYALYLHVMKHNFDQARPLYYNMINYMTGRGIDNSFVLYSFAIYNAITEEEDWSNIKHYAYRAQCAQDRQYTKMKSSKPTFQTKAVHSFDLAEAGFFRQAAYQQNSSSIQKGISWCNYGLCRMIAYRDWDGARECFRRGIYAAPYEGKIVSIFEILLHDKDFMGLEKNEWGVFDECRLHEAEC